MSSTQPRLSRQALNVTERIQSPRSFCAALVLLFAIPVALLGQAAFGIEFEITFHFLLALSAGLIALAVFDFTLPV